MTIQRDIDFEIQHIDRLRELLSGKINSIKELEIIRKTNKLPELLSMCFPNLSLINEFLNDDRIKETVKNEVIESLAFTKIDAAMYDVEEFSNLKIDEDIKERILSKFDYSKITKEIYDLKRLSELKISKEIKEREFRKLNYSKIIRGPQHLRSFLQLSVSSKLKHFILDRYLKTHPTLTQLPEKNQEQIKKILFASYRNDAFLKEKMQRIPPEDKLCVYSNLLDLFDQSILGKKRFFLGKPEADDRIYKKLYEQDKPFFMTGNIIGQLLNIGDNKGNDLQKLYILSGAYADGLKYNSKLIDKEKKLTNFNKKISDSLSISNRITITLNSKQSSNETIPKTIEDALSKIKNKEILFFITPTWPGNMHNIPQALMKIPSGALKGKYMLLLFDNSCSDHFALFGYGCGKISMYIVDEKFEKALKNQLIQNATKSQENSGSPEEIGYMYKHNNENFGEITKDNINKAYGANLRKDDTCIGLDYKNKPGHGKWNCFVNEQTIAMDIMHAICKKCFHEKENLEFDIVKFMIENSKELAYSHFGMLTNKKPCRNGIDNEEFKEELIHRVVDIMVERGIREDLGDKKRSCLDRDAGKSLKSEYAPNIRIELERNEPGTALDRT